MSNTEVDKNQRKEAIAYLTRKMDPSEAAVVELAAYTKHSKSLRMYRSSAREMAMKRYRERKAKEHSDTVNQKHGAGKNRQSKNLPRCRSCHSNVHVTFKFEQRRSGDEGMTAVYTCAKCNVFWT